MSKILRFIFLRPVSYMILFHYRIMKYFYDKNFNFLADCVAQKMLRSYGVEICPGAIISRTVILKHPTAIVIGGSAHIGESVIIHQCVTIGAKDIDRMTKRGKECKQVIGDDVIICAGAKILGDVIIGKNSLIGANAIVTRDVPPNATVVGYNKIIYSDIV